MAEHSVGRPATRPASLPSGMGLRAAVTVGIIVLLALVYALLGAAGVVPLPRTVDALAARQSIGRGAALVSGYYIAQPFVSYGGLSLPPYVFASSTNAVGSGVHVKPSLPDLHAGQMVAIIDTATGDGSRWSPYAIHSVMRADAFRGIAAVVALVMLIVAFGIAGPIAERLTRARP